MEIFDILIIIWNLFSALVDKFWWLILIGFILYYLYKYKYWFRDIDEVSENYGKKLADTDMGGKGQLERFYKTYENYHHLIEKFRHDGNIKRQVKNDWVSYLKSLEIQFDCYMDFGILDEDHLKDAYGRNHKAEMAMEEIEKRFKRLSYEKI